MNVGSFTSTAILLMTGVLALTAFYASQSVYLGLTGLAVQLLKETK